MEKITSIPELEKIFDEHKKAFVIFKKLDNKRNIFKEELTEKLVILRRIREKITYLKGGLV